LAQGKSQGSEAKLRIRAKLLIKGIVQGVGFRPFIYGLAKSRSLSGWVLNSTEGVSIEIEGEKQLVDDFIDQIRPQAPPLSAIDSVEVEYLPPIDYKSFDIRHSEGDKDKYVKISPDICVCNDCLRELFNPSDRRYCYPFINCTNCGPRFTIIADIPYDREKTTMRSFKMCPDCQAEYDDPLNRRFHAQPNACPVCGPSVTLEDLNGKIDCADPIKKAIELITDGKIIAIKGIGGFHLACDATNDKAVQTLRERKRRSFKPYAIMSANLDKIREYCLANDEEAKLIQSVQRSIVLLQKRGDFRYISEQVAPNNNYIGVMLPYTPLHYLLLASPLPALVMTSANISEEPIVIGNYEAKRRLSDLADYFLFHNRDILMRCDDSVSRVVKGQSIMIRRSRGYAPFPVDIDFSMKEILACGGELKNTFCLTKDNHAFISHHVGDLQNIEAFNYYQDSIEHYKSLFRIKPEAIAYDLHPDYLSTKYALDQTDIPSVAVQHHHAHIVSCMAENGLSEKVIGVACDGTGYGLDGKIWGCEFLIADHEDFQRKGHLKYIPLPGGDASTKEPYRTAISYLYSAFGNNFLDLDIDLLRRIDKKKIALIKRMIDNNINAPLTSSCGRLFDAVSSLIGVRDNCTYDAQSAIELEMMADPNETDIYSYKIDLGIGDYGKRPETPPFERGIKGDLKTYEKESGLAEIFIINLEGMIREIVFDLNKLEKHVISARFHNTVADFIVTMCKKIKEESGIESVVLSGGTFQNMYLFTSVFKRLTEGNFKVYFHKRVPTNDGGISLGQALVANSRINK
jgi:hydrogenase maturation protein HypF